MSKTWFITGASRGFGRVFTAAALRRGDRVVATARNLAALDDLAAEYGADLLPLRLDVTDRAGVTQAVRHAFPCCGGCRRTAAAGALRGRRTGDRHRHP